MSKVRPGQRIAVVGAGVSGLVAAAELHRAGHDVHVFEAGPYAGGHTNTVEVETAGRPLAVDTGFIVFNERNYPNFERMLGELGVALPAGEHELLGLRRTRRVRVGGARAARGLRPPRPLVDRGSSACCSTSPGSTASARALVGRRGEGPSLRRFLVDGGYSDYFIERLLVPQASAVWSADPEQMWSFPAAFLAEFFDNHGVLQLRGRPALAHGPGGSRRYVEALIAPFRDRVRLRDAGAPRRARCRLGR